MKMSSTFFVCAVALVGLTAKCKAQDFTLTASTSLTSPVAGTQYTNPADIQGTSSSNYTCTNNLQVDRNELLDWTPQIDLWLPGAQTALISIGGKELIAPIKAGQTWTLNNDQFVSTTWFVQQTGSPYLQAITYIEAKTGDNAFNAGGHVYVTVN